MAHDHPRSRLAVYSLLLTAVTASSTWHVLGKLALDKGMDPSVFLVYRLLLTAGILFLFMKFVLKIPLLIPHESLHVRFLVVGFATFAHSICFLYGLQLTTPFLCAVMQPSVPVIVWLLSLVLGLEQANPRKALGVVLCSLGAVGAASLQADRNLDHGATSVANEKFVTGVVLIVFQCFFYAIHLVFQQPLLQRVPPIQVTAILYLEAGILMAALTVFRSLLAEVLTVTAPTITLTGVPNWALSKDGGMGAWGALAFCVVFASAFTHGIYSWASKQIAPTAVSVFTTVEPLTTTVVSIVLTNASIPTFPEFTCAGIVAVGVMLVLFGGGSGMPQSRAEYDQVKPDGEELEDIGEVDDTP
jgi:drug/metabolite transporter (DMT)-like permease